MLNHMSLLFVLVFFRHQIHHRIRHHHLCQSTIDQMKDKAWHHPILHNNIQRAMGTLNFFSEAMDTYGTEIEIT